MHNATINQMTTPILTVIIPTFNQEKNIVKAIESVKKYIKTPHIITVWDTGSTDQTPTLATHAGAKVIKHPPIKVVEEIRQKTIDKAQTPWILLLDADERITSKLGRKIDQIILQNPADVVKIPRLNYFFGQPIKYAGWWPDYQTRLFKKNSLTWPSIVHTSPNIKPNQKVLKLDLNSYLIHHNYTSITQFIDKTNRYTTTQAKHLAQTKHITTTDLLTQPFKEFIDRYFYYQGYKAKTLGFSLSILMAFYIFITYLKAYRLQNRSWQSPSPLENPKTTKQILHDYLYWRSHTIHQKPFPKLLVKIKLLLLKLF